jgi:acyl-CoA synthetase (AMP-forming)/AMP-acid ligase II
MIDTVYSHFRRQAIARPNAPAVLALGRHGVSFGEMLGFVDHAREKLHSFGVGRESRLGVLSHDRAQTGAALLVAASTGTAVPLHVNMTVDELASMIKRMRVDAIMIGENVSGPQIECVGRSTARVLSMSGDAQKAGLFELNGQKGGVAVDTSEPGEDDVAVLLTTSGSTGTPKVVPQTQLNRVTASLRNQEVLGVGPGERCLNMMPLHHSQGVTGEFLIPMVCGASVVFAEFDPARVVSYVEEYEPTWITLVPSMYMAVLEKLGAGSGVFRGSSLRYVRSSSAKLSPGLRDRLETVFGVPIVEQYGATECAGVANTGLSRSDFHPGSVGRPFHSGVMVTDEEGNPAPSGEKGEVCVSGPTVISGYEDDAKSNAESFRNGWYRTGDEGYFDEDGFLYITGRIREVVNRGGEKFSLVEIDEALLEINGVSQAAAFVVPHARLTHEVYAAAVVAPGHRLSPGKLRAELASRLPWPRMPKRVFLVEELPLNATGKVVRQELSDRFSSEVDRAGT